MIPAVTSIVLATSLVLMAMGAFYALRSRLIDDAILGVVGILEIALVIQFVVGLTNLSLLSRQGEPATFAAYAATLPFIPLGVVYLAIKDKSRWAMISVAVGGFAVAIMTVRLTQLWAQHG